MALSQSVLSELLDAFRAGEGVDLVRDAVHLVLQELIEVEAAEVIGAGRYERTDTRVTERNGARSRLLATHGEPAGVLHQVLPTPGRIERCQQGRITRLSSRTRL